MKKQTKKTTDYAPWGVQCGNRKNTSAQKHIHHRHTLPQGEKSSSSKQPSGPAATIPALAQTRLSGWRFQSDGGEGPPPLRAKEEGRIKKVLSTCYCFMLTLSLSNFLICHFKSHHCKHQNTVSTFRFIQSSSPDLLSFEPDTERKMKGGNWTYYIGRKNKSKGVWH